MSEANALSAAGPQALKLYRALLASVKKIGPFEEQVKKTSVHLARKSAFVGVHPRKEYLLLTVKAEQPLKNPRIFKSEQVSKNRWHLEMKLTDLSELDAETLKLIRTAYDLCG